MTRRSIVVALAAVLVLGTASTGSAVIRFASPAAAAGHPAAVVAGSNAAGHDYATDVFADPWDYSNVDDLIVDTGPAMNASNLRFASGQVTTHFTANGYISPIWGGYGGPLFLGRDGGKPGSALNTARYKKVAFQAYSNRDVSSGLMWFNCARAVVASSCGGGMSFTLKAGWHTYVLNPGASVFAGWPVRWGGTLNGLRLAVSPGAAGSDFALDWFRVEQPGSGAQLTWSNAGLGASEFVWDSDSLDSNNLTSKTGWGVVDIPDVAGSSGTVDLSVLPPGTFRIGVRSPAGFSGWQPVSLASPLPRFITPNAVGDRDYATMALRNPWDFNSASDVAKVGNATNVSFAAGQLAATNTSNDPFVLLRIGAAGIDTRIYRNLTVTSAYDGRFDLRDAAGGGTMARVLWIRPDRPPWIQTDDILTYSGTRTVSIDMGLPNNQLIEPGTSNNSFVSPARVTTLRWDPNEDRGARRWYLKDVQLRSDFATKGTFPITWQDGAYQAGGTATVVADTDRSGCNGRTVASGVRVLTGTNTTVWNTAGVPAGRYWLCLTITRGKAVTSGYADGVLSVGADPVVTPAVLRYVTRVYRDLFNRAPDPTGLEDWTSRLVTGTPRVAVANAITSSTEYRSKLITASYQTYLGRPADAAGLRNWLGAMGRGMTISQMESGFIASPEYYAQAGSTPDGWVTKLYTDVLGRKSATAEVAHWTAQLRAGKSRSQVAMGFLLSTEHLTTVVNGYYQHLLGRGIDPSGQRTWVGILQRGGRDEAIIGGIIASAEYYAKV